MRIRWARGPVAVAAAVLLVACGVPVDHTVRDIDPASIPGGLLGTTPPSDPTTPGATAEDAAVHFTDRAGLLLAVPRDIEAKSTATALQSLLADLTAGPAAAEQDQGLSTALAPTIVLTVTDIIGDEATIDISGEHLPTADQTVAVAQIVLTATSLSGIDTVRLTLDGQPLDAPLVDGALTSKPLTAEDYRQLLAPSRG